MDGNLRGRKSRAAEIICMAGKTDEKTTLEKAHVGCDG